MPWIMDLSSDRPHPPLVGERSADVVVIGAGLTGLTLALLLSRRGFKVVVLEAEGFGSGTTGFTSAHLTALPDLGLAALRRKHGDEAVRATFEAGQRGIALLTRLSDEEGAGAVRLAEAWQYAENEEQRAELDAQIEAMQALDFVHTVGVPPLPFSTEGGLRLTGQAMLDPSRMVPALLRACLREGVSVHESSRVRSCEDGKPCVVTTDSGSVTARDVVQATHTPIGMMVSLQARLKATNSHVLRVRLTADLEPGLFYDLADPYHFLRPLSSQTPDVWLVGGADQATGARSPVSDCFEALESYARAHLPVAAIEERWSHEFFEPADGLPYIGVPMGGGHVHVITGLSGTGLTWGPAAALAIADHLVGDAEASSSSLLRHWAASRVAPMAGAGQVISNNLDALYRFFADRLLPEGDLHPHELAPGAGCLIQDGVRTIAVWRDPEGELHAMSPVWAPVISPDSVPRIPSLRRSGAGQPRTRPVRLVCGGRMPPPACASAPPLPAPCGRARLRRG